MPFVGMHSSPEPPAHTSLCRWACNAIIVHHLPYYARVPSPTLAQGLPGTCGVVNGIITDYWVHTAVRSALLEALAIVYGGSPLHWGLETQWGRLFATWASFG